MARDIYEDHDAADAEQPQDGLGNALIILTTVLLLAAFLVMHSGLKKHFNEGLFKDSSTSSTE
ncbi:MAG: hypothetical protein ACYTG6_06750 [Planctomycetota bacterium]|jgi:hypothetical protein